MDENSRPTVASVPYFAQGVGAMFASVANLEGPPPGLAPVELWNPPHCGALDLVITARGVWVHEGRPIQRPALVRLLSRILRKDPAGYVLVTPVEKLAIQVEDLPFRVVRLEPGEAGTWVGISDQGDLLPLGPDHELVVDEVKGQPQPRVRVRGDLWARVSRSVFYEMVEKAEMGPGPSLWFSSAKTRFCLGQTGE